MKIAFLNDTHLGIRNSSDIFLDNAAKFYDDVFFPYMDEHNIKHIIHWGDYYDNRKAANIKALHHNRKHFLEPMKERGITMDIVPGNHDTYFKDTNTPNSLKELLGFFINEVNIVENPRVLNYDGCRIAMLPWVAKDNYDQCLSFINNCEADVLGGHLELNGFEMQRGILSDHGMDRSLFSRFDMVFSGHYHTKSTQDNIHYLGSQMEFFWSDAGDKKYFHVFDTTDRSLTPVRNPHTLFKRLVYNDERYDYNRVPDLSGQFVKVVVLSKTKPEMYERLIDALQDQNLLDLKIAENFDTLIGQVADSDVSVDDTETLLDTYVDGSNTDLNKDTLKIMMRDLHKEAQTLEIL